MERRVLSVNRPRYSFLSFCIERHSSPDKYSRIGPLFAFPNQIGHDFSIGIIQTGIEFRSDDMIADPFLHDPLPRTIISPLSATRYSSLAKIEEEEEEEKKKGENFYERKELCLRVKRGGKRRKRNGGGDYTTVSFAARRELYSHVTASTLEIHIRNECFNPFRYGHVCSLRAKYSHG